MRPWDWNLHWLSWGNIGLSMANEFKGKCRCDTKPYQAEAWIWSHLTWRFANPYWHESGSLLLCFLPGLNIRRQNGFPESLDSLVNSPFLLAPPLEGLGKNLCVESASGHSFLILELPCKKKKKSRELPTSQWVEMAFGDPLNWNGFGFKIFIMCFSPCHLAYCGEKNCCWFRIFCCLHENLIPPVFIGFSVVFLWSIAGGN